MARRAPFHRYSADDRAAALERYDAARARGLTDKAATQVAGVSSTTLAAWRERAADAAVRPSTVARRRCLRCGEGFRSTWAGHRVCDRCADGHTADALPDSWGATPTEGYGSCR